jgi:peroxiredoxin
LLRDLAVIAAIVLVVRAYQQRNLPSGPAPALAGADLDGAAVALEDYRGKPVVLHFWATWCGVCKAEQHNLDAIAGDLPVLSVASRSGDAAEVAAYVREHEVAPRVVSDPKGTLAQRFGVSAFPTTFIVDASGEIEHAEVGYTTELGLRARMWLASF